MYAVVVIIGNSREEQPTMSFLLAPNNITSL